MAAAAAAAALKEEAASSLVSQGCARGSESRCGGDQRAEKEVILSEGPSINGSPDAEIILREGGVSSGMHLGAGHKQGWMQTPPGTVVYVCNPSTWEAETERS